MIRSIVTSIVFGLVAIAAGNEAFGQVYWVDMNAPNASDSNSGSLAQPWKTISRAMEPGILAPGDTLVIRQGVYREAIEPTVSGTSPLSRVVIRAADGEDVVVSGSNLYASDRVSMDGLLWVIEDYAPLPQPGNDEVYARDVVVVDGVLMHPRWDTDQLEPGEFTIEDPFSPQSRILIRPPLGANPDPAFHVFELGIRSSLFRTRTPNGVDTDCGAPESAGWIHVIGLTFKHASNMAQSGAVCPGSVGVILEDVTVEATNGLGILMIGERHTLLRTKSLYNGQAGIGGSCQRCRLIETESSYNNWRGHDPFWEAGGGKWFESNDLRVIGHQATGNDGPGLWLDGDNNDVTISASVFHNNLLAGVMVELRSGNVKLIENTITRTRREDWSGAGILVQAAGDVEISGNSISYNDGAGIWLRSDPREVGGGNKISANVLSDNVVRTGQDRAQFVVWGRDMGEVESNSIACNFFKSSTDILNFVVQTEEELVIEGTDIEEWDAFWSDGTVACSFSSPDLR